MISGTNSCGIYSMFDFMLITVCGIVILKFQQFMCRTSRSEFIVGVNKYLEAQNHKLSVGMRFKMRFECEEVPERRCFFCLLICPVL